MAVDRRNKPYYYLSSTHVDEEFSNDSAEDGTKDDVAKFLISILCKNEGKNTLAEILAEEYEPLRRFNINTPFALKSFCESYQQCFNLSIPPFNGDAGAVEVEVTTAIKLCPTHSKKMGSCAEDGECDCLHMCRYYLLSGKCEWFARKQKPCLFGHRLATDHNEYVLKRYLMDHLKLEEMRTLMKRRQARTLQTRPAVCRFYNQQTGCSRGPQCMMLHLCRRFTLGDCKFGQDCNRSHDLTEPTVKSMLDNFAISAEEFPAFMQDNQRQLNAASQSPSTPTTSFIFPTPINLPIGPAHHPQLGHTSTEPSPDHIHFSYRVEQDKLRGGMWCHPLDRERRFGTASQGATPAGPQSSTSSSPGDEGKDSFKPVMFQTLFSRRRGHILNADTDSASVENEAKKKEKVEMVEEPESPALNIFSFLRVKDPLASTGHTPAVSTSKEDNCASGGDESNRVNCLSPIRASLYPDVDRSTDGPGGGKIDEGDVFSKTMNSGFIPLRHDNGNPTSMRPVASVPSQIKIKPKLEIERDAILPRSSEDILFGAKKKGERRSELVEASADPASESHLESVVAPASAPSQAANMQSIITSIINDVRQLHGTKSGPESHLLSFLSEVAKQDKLKAEIEAVIEKEDETGKDGRIKPEKYLSDGEISDSDYEPEAGASCPPQEKVLFDYNHRSTVDLIDTMLNGPESSKQTDHSWSMSQEAACHPSRSHQTMPLGNRSRRRRSKRKHQSGCHKSLHETVTSLEADVNLEVVSDANGDVSDIMSSEEDEDVDRDLLVSPEDPLGVAEVDEARQESIKAQSVKTDPSTQDQHLLASEQQRSDDTSSQPQNDDNTTARKPIPAENISVDKKLRKTADRNTSSRKSAAHSCLSAGPKQSPVRPRNSSASISSKLSSRKPSSQKSSNPKTSSPGKGSSGSGKALSNKNSSDPSRPSADHSSSSAPRRPSPANRPSYPRRSFPENKRVSCLRKFSPTNRRSSAPQRPSPANARLSPASKEPSYPRRFSPTHQRSSPVNRSSDRRSSPTNRRSSPTNRRSSDRRRFSPANRRSSPFSRRYPSPRRISRDERRRTPNPRSSPNAKRYPCDGRRSSPDRNRFSPGHRRSPLPQRRSSVSPRDYLSSPRRHSPGQRRSSPDRRRSSRSLERWNPHSRSPRPFYDEGHHGRRHSRSPHRCQEDADMMLEGRNRGHHGASPDFRPGGCHDRAWREERERNRLPGEFDECRSRSRERDNVPREFDDLRFESRERDQGSREMNDHRFRSHERTPCSFEHIPRVHRSAEIRNTEHDLFRQRSRSRSRERLACSPSLDRKGSHSLDRRWHAEIKRERGHSISRTSDHGNIGRHQQPFDSGPGSFDSRWPGQGVEGCGDMAHAGPSRSQHSLDAECPRGRDELFGSECSLERGSREGSAYQMTFSNEEHVWNPDGLDDTQALSNSCGLKRSSIRSRLGPSPVPFEDQHFAVGEGHEVLDSPRPHFDEGHYLSEEMHEIIMEESVQDQAHFNRQADILDEMADRDGHRSGGPDPQRRNSRRRRFPEYRADKHGDDTAHSLTEPEVILKYSSQSQSDEEDRLHTLPYGQRHREALRCRDDSSRSSPRRHHSSHSPGGVRRDRSGGDRPGCCDMSPHHSDLRYYEHHSARPSHGRSSQSFCEEAGQDESGRFSRAGSETAFCVENSRDSLRFKRCTREEFDQGSRDSLLRDQISNLLDKARQSASRGASPCPDGHIGDPKRHRESDEGELSWKTKRRRESGSRDPSSSEQRGWNAEFASTEDGGRRGRSFDPAWEDEQQSRGFRHQPDEVLETPYSGVRPRRGRGRGQRLRGRGRGRGRGEHFGRGSKKHPRKYQGGLKVKMVCDGRYNGPVEFNHEMLQRGDMNDEGLPPYQDLDKPYDDTQPLAYGDEVLEDQDYDGQKFAACDMNSNLYDQLGDDSDMIRTHKARAKGPDLRNLLRNRRISRTLRQAKAEPIQIRVRRRETHERAARIKYVDEDGREVMVADQL